MSFASKLNSVLSESKRSSVGFFIRLPKELADQYPDADKDGDTSDPHITLLYVGKVPSSDIAKLKKAGKEIIKTYDKMECFVGGLAYFDADLQIAHSMVECKGLAKLHKDLWDAALEVGVSVEHRFAEYTPHVTIACLEKRDYDGSMPSGSFIISEIELWGGNGEALASFKLK